MYDTSLDYFNLFRQSSGRSYDTRLCHDELYCKKSGRLSISAALGLFTWDTRIRKLCYCEPVP